MSEDRELERRDYVRASDRERDETAAELRIHWVEGRITLEELERRLEGVLAARTIRELGSFVRDLPSVEDERTERPTRRERARVAPPGIFPFTHRLVVPAARERTRALALDKIAPGLHAHGYELVSESPNGFVFERSRRPGWALAAAVFLFPIGLLALSQRTTNRVVLSLEDHGSGGTNMTVYGTAPRSVRKAFAQLTFS